MDEPEYVTLDQAAKRLGISVSSVRRLADSGQLLTRRTPGGHRRVLLEDVEKLAIDSDPNEGITFRR